MINVGKKTKKDHETLMWFRQCLLDECTKQLGWPATPTTASVVAHQHQTTAHYRTLWVLLLWWRESRADRLTGVFNKAFTRMWFDNKERVWHEIKVNEWLQWLYDTERACFGYDNLHADEKYPAPFRYCPHKEGAQKQQPFVRIQLNALYRARQTLVACMPADAPRLPERFSTEYDPEELVTLHVMLQCPMCNIEWMTREYATLRVVALFPSAEDQRAFWVESTRRLMIMTMRDNRPTTTVSPLLLLLQAASMTPTHNNDDAQPCYEPRTLFPGLLETSTDNGFRVGGVRMPMYARAWLMLLHFAYESLGFPSTYTIDDARLQPMLLYDEIVALRTAIPRLQHQPHLRATMQKWVDLSALDTPEEVGAFWDELAQHMQSILLASTREIAWQKDTEGLGDFIASLE
jgi:hypothetical protein